MLPQDLVYLDLFNYSRGSTTKQMVTDNNELVTKVPDIVTNRDIRVLSSCKF